MRLFRLFSPCYCLLMISNLLLNPIGEPQSLIELHAYFVEVYSNEKQEELCNGYLIVHTAAIKFNLSGEDAIPDVEMRILQFDPRQHPVIVQGDNVLPPVAVDMPQDRRQDVPSTGDGIKAILNANLPEINSDEIRGVKGKGRHGFTGRGHRRFRITVHLFRKPKPIVRLRRGQYRFDPLYPGL